MKRLFLCAVATITALLFSGSALAQQPQQPIAPKQSNSMSLKTLNEYMIKGVDANIANNYTEAVKYYQLIVSELDTKSTGDAALTLYSDAYYLLGYNYFYGRGVAKNYTEAAKLFTKAARNEVAGGQYKNFIFFGLAIEARPNFLR